MYRTLAVYSRPGHSPTEWAIRQGTTEQPHNEPCGQALLHAGRTSLNCRKLNWTAPVKLTAVQPSPWLYRESTAPLGTKAETTQVRRALPNTKPNKKATKEIKQIQRELMGGARGGH